MGDVRAKPQTSTPEGTSSDLHKIVTLIPIAGPYLATFFDVSSKAKAVILAILFFLVIYPIVSLAMALLIISLLPSTAKDSARSFILNSIGVDDDMMRQFNRSNEVIDALIPMHFEVGGDEQATERVAYGQKIRFESLVRSVNNGLPACIGKTTPPDDEPFGQLSVKSLASSARPYTVGDIDFKNDELLDVGILGDEQWAEFQKASRSGDVEKDHPLRIKVTESSSPAVRDFFNCNKVSVDIYMTIFKPAMVRGGK